MAWLADFVDEKIWTRYSGHCFAHLNMNVDTGEKNGHISFCIRERPMSLRCWTVGKSASCVGHFAVGLASLAARLVLLAGWLAS